MATWGDFNSLIQLSIGLNAAFATFSDFLGDGLPREERRIDRLIKTIDKRPPGDCSPPSQDSLSDRRELQFLLGRCASNRVSHERFRANFVRIGGFLCAFLGAAALIYASYNSETPILFEGQLVVYLLLIPFAFGACHGMYTAIKSYLEVSLKRQVIEERIAERRRNLARQRQVVKNNTSNAPEGAA